MSYNDDDSYGLYGGDYDEQYEEYCRHYDEQISKSYLLQVSPIISHFVEYIMVIPIVICMKRKLGLILQGLKWKK